MSVQTEMEAGIADQRTVADAVEKFISNIVAQLEPAIAELDDNTTNNLDFSKLREIKSVLAGDSIRFAKLIEQAHLLRVIAESETSHKATLEPKNE